MHVLPTHSQRAVVALVAFSAHVFVGCGGDRYDKYSTNPPINNSDVASNSASMPAEVSEAAVVSNPEAVGLGEAVKPISAGEPAGSAVQPSPEEIVANTAPEPAPEPPTPETLPEEGLAKSPPQPSVGFAGEPKPPVQQNADLIKPRFAPTFGGETELVQTGREMIVSDQMLPVDVEATYKMSVTVFASGPQAAVSTNFIGFICCDGDEQRITTYHVAKFPGAKDTTLAADLEQGDRQLVLQNATGWNNAGVDVQRSLAWYPKADEVRAPNVYGYTRHTATGLWGQGAVMNNVIALREPWAGPHLVAGTPVRNTTSGGTYNYALLAGEAVPNVPTTYTATIKGVWKDGKYSDIQFRPGTAFIQPLILVDWGRDGKETGTTLTVRNFLCERLAD